MHHDACRLVASYLALSGSKHTCPVAGWLKHVRGLVETGANTRPFRVSGTRWCQHPQNLHFFVLDGPMVPF